MQPGSSRFPAVSQIHTLAITIAAALGATSPGQSVPAGGEPTNRLPFTAPPTTTVVVRASPGFDWGDAGIGAAAALGLVTVSAGSIALRRSGSTDSRRRIR